MRYNIQPRDQTSLDRPISDSGRASLYGILASKTSGAAKPEGTPGIIVGVRWVLFVTHDVPKSMMRGLGSQLHAVHSFSEQIGLTKALGSRVASSMAESVLPYLPGGVLLLTVPRNVPATVIPLCFFSIYKFGLAKPIIYVYRRCDAGIK